MMNKHSDKNYPLRFLKILEETNQLYNKKFQVTEIRDIDYIIGTFQILKICLESGEILINNVITKKQHVLEFMNRNKKLGGKGFFWACFADTKKELEKLRNLYPFELKLKLLGKWGKVEESLINQNIIPPFRTKYQVIDKKKNFKKNVNKKRKNVSIELKPIKKIKTIKDYEEINFNFIRAIELERMLLYNNLELNNNKLYNE